MPVFCKSFGDSLSLRGTGPVLSLQISVPDVRAAQLIEARKDIPPPVLGDVLLDTGASVTAVQERILTGLGLHPIREVDITTPAGDVKMRVYPAKLSFPGTGLPPRNFIEVVGVDLGMERCVGLLGRDVLDQMVVIYDGIRGQITLAR
jgi:hypothetical protein